MRRYGETGATQQYVQARDCWRFKSIKKKRAIVAVNKSLTLQILKLNPDDFKEETNAHTHVKQLFPKKSEVLFPHASFRPDRLPAGHPDVPRGHHPEPRPGAESAEGENQSAGGGARGPAQPEPGGK